MSTTNNQELFFYDSITNEELRRRLMMDHQYNCGPVTPSTRRVLLKKLVQLETSHNEDSITTQHSIISHKDVIDDTLSDADSSVIENGNGTYDNGEMEMSELVSDISVDVGRYQPRPSTRRYSPRRKTDEMNEAIKSFSEAKKMKIKQSVGSEDSSQSSRSQRHRIVQNLVISEPRVANLNDFSSEGSDSDDNENVPTTRPAIDNTLSSFKISRIALPRIFSNGSHKQTPKAALSRPPIHRSTLSTSKTASSLLNYSDSESDVEEIKKDKICKLLLSHRPGLGRSKVQKASIKDKIFSFFSNLRAKLTFSSGSSNTDFSKSYKYISYSLLTLVIIFFTIIFSVYFYAKFTFVSKQALDLRDFDFIGDKSKLVAPICSENSSTYTCLLHESDRKPALNLIKEIKSRIDKTIYKNYCELAPNRRRLKLSDFIFKKNQELQEYGKTYGANEDREKKVADMSDYSRFEHDYNNALKLIELNPSWNMQCTDKLVGDILLTSDYSLNLPLQCRLSMFINDYFWIISATLLAVVTSTLVLFYYRYTKRKEIREQSQVYELIEKSMELLQSPDEPQSMPVLHIRDTLLSPSERKSVYYKRVWNKVVNHIENSESRVKVEFKKIDGEDFKAWKWIANTGPQFPDSGMDSETDNESIQSIGLQTQKIGGVEWQGQAFAHLPKGSSSRTEEKEVNPSITPEMYRNKNFQALTRFLKIRNMFEKEAQYVDPNWSKKIKNTILEKTASTSDNGSHDIVHIEVEDDPQEGLVYLKCSSIRGATNAFHALHGWWCEKKLVSVKFLKDDRYYQRFPNARYMNTPLTAEQIR